VFWLLLLGSAAAAVLAWRADPMPKSRLTKRWTDLVDQFTAEAARGLKGPLATAT
jgi:hypothetical protein